MSTTSSVALSPKDFLKLNLPIFDVRSPCEFKHAHIPGAINLPLFNDEERALVGTKYKHAGKEKAIILGLELVGPKLARFVLDAKRFSSEAPHILVHCWRGGMRSQSMAWLLRMAGFQVSTLEGGYKNYRHLVLETCNKTYPQLKIIGGMTGTGKTELLYILQDKYQEQILDLEGLAHHKGSSFGALGNLPQPTTEQFENNLYEVLSRLDLNKTIWLEDESRCIGSVQIPQPLFNQMREAPVLVVNRSKEERVQRLMKEYGHFNKEDLLSCTRRIEKRLGGLKTKEILSAIDEGQISLAIYLILDYYDKTYLFGLQKRSNSSDIKNLNLAEFFKVLEDLKR
jgi:tRNA 2-selenouridine synthase